MGRIDSATVSPRRVISLRTPSEEDHTPQRSGKRKKTAAKNPPTSKRVAPSQASSSKSTVARSQASTSKRAAPPRPSSSTAASSVKQTQPSRIESPSRPGTVEEDGEEEGQEEDDKEVDVPHFKTIGRMLRGSGEEWSVEQLETLDFPIRDLPSTTDVQRELGACVQGHPADDSGDMMMFDAAEDLPATRNIGTESYTLVKAGGSAFYQGPAPLFKRIYALRHGACVGRCRGLQAAGFKAVAVGHC